MAQEESDPQLLWRDTTVFDPEARCAFTWLPFSLSLLVLGWYSGSGELPHQASELLSVRVPKLRVCSGGEDPRRQITLSVGCYPQEDGSKVMQLP